MADNSTEVATQSPSPTDIDLLINSDAAAEELSQNGLETTSEIKQIETENRESETDEVMIPSKVKKNRKCAVLDSDDDDSMQEHAEKTLSENVDDTSTKAHSDETRIENELQTNDTNQSDGESVKKNMKRSRIKPVWNSEHEDEDSSDYDMYTKTSFSKGGLGDKIKSSLSAKSVKKKLIKKQQSSSESENGNSSDSENEDKVTSKILAWNSEGDSDGSDKGDDTIKEKNNSSVSSKARQLRKKPVEEIQKIHSESQRMVRESTVCLPYHKPKQRSLLEFLNRKRVNNEDCAKPTPRDAGPVVQVLEDRVKEIEEFFKSESEESENETEKVDAVLLPDQEVLPPNPELSSAVDSNPTLTSADDVPDVPEKILLESEIPQSPTTSQNVEMTSPPDSQEDIESTNNSAAVPQDMAGSSNSIDKTTNEVKSSADLISDGSNDSWLDYSSVFSHKEKVENIKRLSIAKVNKPTLHGRPGQLLDFDLESESTPDQKEKVNNLIERFVQQVTNTKKSPKKKDIQISIVHKVMNADGQLELKRDVLNVPVENNTSECASAGRRQLLRDSLRQSISAKRAVDRMKKIESQQIENEDFQSDGKLDSEPEEEILSDEPETEDMDEEEEEEENGYERKKKKKKKKKNMFVDEEAEDSDENNMDDDEDDDDQDDEDTVKVKSSIYHSAGQSEDETSKQGSQTDDIVLGSKSDLKLCLKTSGRFSSLEGLTPNLNESDSSEDLIPKLRDSQNNDASNVEELIGLCSGKFPDSTPGGDTLKSQLNEMDDESEEDFKPFSRIIPMDDDDDDSNSSPPIKLQVENDGDEPESAPVLLDDEEEKSKPNRRKRAVICLSDDEDENEERSVVDEEEMHEEEREFRGLTDFFEDEAELSGSEVGSGDEREDEVDDWEEEEGDKEDIDENEVREQIGRAHMKTLLDQDQRDVRLFQELFLEDGDLHSDGGGRQRQFRWKNADGEETEDNRPKTQEEEADEAAEEQDDLTWRKMRSEREKWLQQQKSQQMQEVKKDVPLVMKRNGKMVKVNTKTASNAVEKANSSAAAPVVDLKQFISPKKSIAATVRRGSFLRRSEKDLSAIASLTKSVLPVQAPKAGSNFVFASITPERPPIEERRKVKQEASCGSSDQNPAPAKKAKVSLSAKSIFSYF